MYKAVQDRNGKVLKGGASQLVEIAANRGDSYDQLLSRATEALSMQAAGKRLLNLFIYIFIRIYLT